MSAWSVRGRIYLVVRNCYIPVCRDRTRHAANDGHQYPTSKRVYKGAELFDYGAREFSARKTLSCGLVTDVFPHADVSRKTTNFILTLAEGPRVTLESIKRFQGKAAGLPLDMRAEFAVTVRALAATEGV